MQIYLISATVSRFRHLNETNRVWINLHLAPLSITVGWALPHNVK
jgi:hypothetical protein